MNKSLSWNSDGASTNVEKKSDRLKQVLPSNWLISRRHNKQATLTCRHARNVPFHAFHPVTLLRIRRLPLARGQEGRDNRGTPIRRSSISGLSNFADDSLGEILGRIEFLADGDEDGKNKKVLPEITS
ncbi:hypothetical protein TNIN_405281 [Trichonephila inaurata madagascariensis]|uniref:Uncharacterized protein n=1 Tax=Trichonephila inaurata madagascariensis TaxID=2747483 RepID=A0A8X6XIV0_9ARAC|nr:hypothetical protein TNIN_405281 [Trichonephila inaurata madagascariensis]